MKRRLKERLALLGGTTLLALAVIGAIVQRPFRRARRRRADQTAAEVPRSGIGGAPSTVRR